MQCMLIWSKSDWTHRRLSRGIHLGFLLAVMCAMLGCSSSGGGAGDDDDLEDTLCGGSSVNDFMNAQVAEIVAGLTFTFMDGEVFQAGLAGDAMTMIVDALTNTTVSMTLATANSMAQGEGPLVACNIISDPSCLFEVTVTTSDFPNSEGPQMADVLVLRDWRFRAQVDTCANRIAATMIVENSQGTAVASESLDLPVRELCPLLCPSS